jgi:hypothetical protein
VTDVEPPVGHGIAWLLPLMHIVTTPETVFPGVAVWNSFPVIIAV